MPPRVLIRFMTMGSGLENGYWLVSFDHLRPGDTGNLSALWELRHMPDKKKLADIACRATAVREIARGIFDIKERRFLLAYIADAEKLAAGNVRVRKHP